MHTFKMQSSFIVSGGYISFLYLNLATSFLVYQNALHVQIVEKKENFSNNCTKFVICAARYTVSLGHSTKFFFSLCVFAFGFGPILLRSLHLTFSFETTNSIRSTDPFVSIDRFKFIGIGLKLVGVALWFFVDSSRSCLFSLLIYKIFNSFVNGSFWQMVVSVLTHLEIKKN